MNNMSSSNGRFGYTRRTTGQTKQGVAAQALSKTQGNAGGSNNMPSNNAQYLNYNNPAEVAPRPDVGHTPEEYGRGPSPGPRVDEGRSYDDTVGPVVGRGDKLAAFRQQQMWKKRARANQLAAFKALPRDERLAKKQHFWAMRKKRIADNRLARDNFWLARKGG